MVSYREKVTILLSSAIVVLFDREMESSHKLMCKNNLCSENQNKLCTASTIDIDREKNDWTVPL